MVRTDLGRRIELVSMDSHFFDISVALHRVVKKNSVPAYQINSYSTRERTTERLEGVLSAMRKIGGMDSVVNEPMQIQFSCGAAHQEAVRRTFLEACKLDITKPMEPRPMEIYDKKTDTTIHVTSQDDGIYKITADLENKRVSRRIATMIGGLVKLAGMEPITATSDQVCFSCGQNHHNLISILLKLALNARGVIRNRELAATRGVLNAPGQQG